MIQDLAKPQRSYKTLAKLLPWIQSVGLICGVFGIWQALIVSPADYVQGEVVRIMYIHVPASWGALAIYTVMAITSALAFIRKLPALHLLSKALAPIGATFCFISLITGSIWGKPTWGAWWVWDARLTSMLLLLFLYLGYILLTQAYDRTEKGLAVGAVIALVGWINVPIIKWSVDWWYTLHQPASIMRLSKPAIHSSMMKPLFLMAVAYACYAFVLTVWRLRLELDRQKLLAVEERLR